MCLCVCVCLRVFLLRKVGCRDELCYSEHNITRWPTSMEQSTHMLMYSVNFHFYIEEPAQVLRNHWKSTELLTSEGMPNKDLDRSWTRSLQSQRPTNARLAVYRQCSFGTLAMSSARAQCAWWMSTMGTKQGSLHVAPQSPSSDQQVIKTTHLSWMKSLARSFAR